MSDTATPTAPPADGDSAPGLKERIAEVRQAASEGRSFVAERTGEPEPAEKPETPEAPKEPTPEPEEPAAEAEPSVEPEEPEVEEDEGDDDARAAAGELPPGWEKTPSGKVKRPDGTWAGADDVAAIEAGETPPWQVRQDGGAPEGTGDAEAGDEAPEAPEAPEGAEAAEPEPEFEMVELPGRHPDEPDREWEITDPELAEDIRRLRNGYMRGEEAKRQLESAGQLRDEVEGQRAELDEVYTRLEHDATGFILDEVTKPEIRKEIALHLLHDREVFDAVLDEFGNKAFDDPDLKLRRKELDLERRERREQTEKNIRRSREERRQLGVFKGMLTDWVQQVPESQRRAFLDVAASRVERTMKQHKIELFRDVERDITSILNQSGTFAAFGVDPSARSSAADTGDQVQAPGAERTRTEAGGSTRPAAPAGTRSGSAARRERQPVRARRRTGEDFKESTRRKREAATVAHGGTGAAPSRMEKPPEGQGVKERLSWLKEKMGR